MKRWLAALATCSPALVLAQALNDADVDRASIIEQRIEQLAEATEDENLDFNTLFEQLGVYYDFPLNLNTATEEELQGLALLSNYQIRELLSYRATYGPLLSKYELPYLPDWDQATVQLIAPFITIAPDAERQRIRFKDLQDGRHEWVMRWQRILEPQEGYAPLSPEELAANPNARYLGSPDKVYARYRYRYSDRVSLGFTAEKDNGEAFFGDSQPNGFDFWSGHLYLRNFGAVKQAAVGDYQAQFGQGLTFWSGLGFNRKSAFSTSTSQSGRGINAYTSINENLFLRGAAATVQVADVSLTAFYSGKHIDGNVAEAAEDSTDSAEPDVLISSFQESGFHRTPAEVADKDAIFQRHLGGHLSYTKPRLELGFTAVHMELEGSIGRSAEAYSQFRFNGKAQQVLGVDYQWQFRNFLIFGETTRSSNGGWATLNGLNITMNPRLSFNLTQRYYARNFQPVASVAFGEGSTVENEAGVYLGVEFRPFKRWKLNAFYDQFRFPWLRYQTDAPSVGHDFLAQLEYQASSRLSVYLRYRDRVRQLNTREETQGVDYLVQNPRQQLRLHASYQASKQWRFRSRMELSSYRRGTEPRSSGFMIYQDVIREWEKLRITLRYALFDTDNFDSRIYAYENDVLYFFSIPAYSGRGTRAYVLVNYEFSRKLECWLRWAQSYYTDRNEVGSGRETIAGNTRTEVKVQLRYLF